MSKAKNFKQILLEKGERIGLIVAAFLMALLMLIGIINMTDTPDSGTEEFPKQIEAATARIRSAINGPAGSVPQMPELARGPMPYETMAALPQNRMYFDPNGIQDNRRINPVVLDVTEISAKWVLAKVPSYDIQEIDGDLKIGVLEYAPAKGEADPKDKTAKFLDAIKGRKPGKKPTRPTPKNPAGFMGGGPGFMGGGPGFMGGGPGFPGPGEGEGEGNPGGFKGGGPSGPGPAPGGFMGSGPGDAGNSFIGMPGPGIGGEGMGSGYQQGWEEPGQRMNVKYVELDETKLQGKRPALTIYPKRMIVVEGAFPYKAQLEEIRKALRLDKLSDVYTTPDAVPFFRGVIVQRRVLGPDGKPRSEWSEFDYVDSFRPVMMRKLQDRDEDPKLYPVLLHEDHELTMPLPYIVSGSYPDTEKNLASIKDTLEKMREKSKGPIAPPPPSRLKGQGSPFKRQGGGGETLYGQPKLGQDGEGDFGLPTPGMGKGSSNPYLGGEDMMGKGGTQQPLNYEPPEHILIRIVDADVLPGLTYEYRMHVRMQNPNWVGPKDRQNPEKYKLVSRRSDADIEILPVENLPKDHPSPLAPAPNRWPSALWERQKVAQVTLPRENFLYANEPALVSEPKDPKKPTVELKPGQGLLQYQRWLPFAKISGYDEPVGDWVVADIVVNRGQYVGGKQFVNLPLWSSEYNRYIFRELPPDPKTPKSKEPRRGVIMDPAKPGPDLLAVEVEGGKVRTRIGGKSVEDDSAYEILLMTDDGKLQLRSSASDRDDENRKNREKTWKEWLETINKFTDKVNPGTGTNPMPKGPNFGD